MHCIGIFASGSGSNAENIARHFKNSALARVVLVFCNNSQAGVLQRMENLKIPCKVFNRKDFYETNNVLNILNDSCIDFIVLAGFLWLMPEKIIKAFPKKIVNIHPALLPGFGGKGMYGFRVHQAVIDQKAKETGITIHFVDEHYDNGDIIFRKAFPVSPTDTPETIEKKVRALELEYFPKVIEALLNKQPESTSHPSILPDC